MEQQSFINKMAKIRQFLTKEKGKKPTEVHRIPVECAFIIKRVGNGNFKKGLLKLLVEYQCNLDTNDGMKSEQRLMMQHCNEMMEDLKNLFPKDQYNHFGEFPRFFLNFLKTGNMNVDILKKGRNEKPLNNFDKEESN